MKRRPSGKKAGKAFGENAPPSLVVTAEQVPPELETRITPRAAVPKRMTPSEFIEPPTALISGRTHSVVGRPPVTSIFFSLPSDPEKTTCRLSGSQNGTPASPSAPDNSLLASESSGRTQRLGRR